MSQFFITFEPDIFTINISCKSKKPRFTHRYGVTHLFKHFADSSLWIDWKFKHLSLCRDSNVERGPAGSKKVHFTFFAQTKNGDLCRKKKLQNFFVDLKSSIVKRPKPSNIQFKQRAIPHRLNTNVWINGLFLPEGCLPEFPFLNEVKLGWNSSKWFIF